MTFPCVELRLRRRSSRVLILSRDHKPTYLAPQSLFLPRSYKQTLQASSKYCKTMLPGLAFLSRRMENQTEFHLCFEKSRSP